MYPRELISIINFLKKLPGVGLKTAERFAFNLLKWDEESLKDFSKHLYELKSNIKNCEECGALVGENSCYFCNAQLRNTNIICIISSIKDVFSIEKTNTYKGLYHIIDNLLSPIEGKSFESLHLDKLKKRIERYKVKEIIIALDSTIEGDATSLFIKEHLKSLNVKISRLAFGLPIGSTLEYIDEGTLSTALLGRNTF